jgi:integrase
MFNSALEDGKLRYVPHFTLLKEPPPRSGVLEQSRYDALQAALPPHGRVAVAIEYHIGMRRGEVCGLRWERVNFLDGCIRLNARETKNDEAREIPITAELDALLRARHDQCDKSCPFVCFRTTRQGETVQLGDFRKAFCGRCVKLGLGRLLGTKHVGLIFYDLRRTFVTDAESPGAPRGEVVKISIHKTEAVFKRYAIENRERRQAALQEIAAYRATRNRASSWHESPAAPPQ